MADVVVGLAGIVVGGVLTGAVDQVGDWRRRKRDLRTAARLVFADALQCSTAFDMALSVDDWWTDVFRTSVDEWRQYRQDLAGEMSPDHLDTVQGAFRQVLFVETLRADPDEGFGDWRDTVQEAKDAIDEATAILLIYTRTRRERSKATKELGAGEPDPSGDSGASDG